MFKKKGRPELYEILQTNKSGSGTVTQKKGEITSVPALSGTPTGSESRQETHTPPAVAVEKPYPKLKIPFPTKAKQKDQKSSFKFGKYLIAVILIIALIVVVYLVIHHIRLRQDAQTIPPGNPPAPFASVSYWTNRMIFYDDTTAGMRSAEKTVAFLKEDGIKDVFIRNDKIKGGATKIFVCAGKYANKEEAIKDRSRLKKLHQNFTTVDAVEIVEGK